MSSIILDVANGVTDELNAEFGGDLTAVREYVPEYDLPDFDVIKCTVVPRDKDTSLIAKDRSQQDIDIDVALQKKMTVADKAELDSLEVLFQQIENYFLFKFLENVDAFCFRSKYRPLFAPENIREKKQFTGVLNFGFRSVGGLAMSALISRKIVMTSNYAPISSVSLVGIVEITAPVANVNPLYIQGDDGSTDVPMVPGEYHVLRRVDLSLVKVKGTPGDILTVVGGTA